MSSRSAVFIASLVFTLAVAGVATAKDGGRPLATTMTGAEEAPGPGDADATGQADLRLNQGQGRICFDLSWENIDGTVFAAHVHKAPPGEPGPIVVPLFDGTFGGTDSLSDCVQVERATVKDIRKHPSDYYVNVHSLPGFPSGAIRGQLSK